jgi:uncharacterized membrane protein YheB (UPF0754 family)
MSEIKSALELALERTADVKSDKAAIDAHETKQLGMKLAGKLMDEPATDVKSELKKLDKQRREWALEGYQSVLVSHLALPTQEADLERLRTVGKGLAAVARDANAVSAVMEQVEQLLQQYLDNKTQLVESLRQQFEPRLRQKEQELARQTGQQIKLDPASDPEFAKALSENMRRLQTQYNQVIDQARDQVKTYL